MTKDRRLGRGLAALLGTPVDEEGVVDGSVATMHSTSAPEGNASPAGTIKEEQQSELGRVEMIRALNGQAHSAQATKPSPPASEMVSSRAVLDLPVDQIEANPFQPRRDFKPEEIASLAASLQEHEQLQPVLVRRVGDRFQLISGERRLRAAIQAGMKTIRAEIRQADDRLVAELAIIENLQRKDLNAIEKALSFKRYLTEHRCKQEDLAKRLKIDRSSIANMMRLLELPASIQESVQRDEISAGHARALLTLGNERQQLEYAHLVKVEGWSVREIERRVAEVIAMEDAIESGDDGEASRQSNRRTKTAQIASLEQELKMVLGTKVEIRLTSRGKGKIVISFTNSEEFERIHDSMMAVSGGKFKQQVA